MGHGSETQLKVGESLIYLIYHFKDNFCIFETDFADAIEIVNSIITPPYYCLDLVVEIHLLDLR